jgi:hypothetical protein
VVSDLFDGSYHHNIIGVYVPVVRNGAVRFVLGAGITAASFGDVLRAQSFGRHAVATIYDRRERDRGEQQGRTHGDRAAGREPVPPP